MDPDAGRIVVSRAAHDPTWSAVGFRPKHLGESIRYGEKSPGEVTLGLNCGASPQIEIHLNEHNMQSSLQAFFFCRMPGRPSGRCCCR